MTEKICTRIYKKLTQSMYDAMVCSCTAAGDNKFEVRTMPGHQHVVDLHHHTCSCKKWDLSGIPCGHAVAVIRDLQQNPVDFVHSCYHKETQMAIYNNLLQPVRGSEQWDPVPDMEPIRPPAIIRPTGRPKKSRNKEPGEAPKTTKLSRKNIPNKCSKCGVLGHKATSCKGPSKKKPAPKQTPTAAAPQSTTASGPSFVPTTSAPPLVIPCAQPNPTHQGGKSCQLFVRRNLFTPQDHSNS